MVQSVVSDNWSLQDITNLLAYGFDQDDAGEIVFNGEEHSYQPVPLAIIQTEALFDFITDLILRDEILVDEDFTNVWEGGQSPILKARDMGVVKAYPFLSDAEKISGPRDQIIEYICTTESLKISHQKNVNSWDAGGQPPDPLLSATLWGGAGMCARSFVYEKSYTPHPLRKRLFLNSGFMLPASDALHQLTTFLDDKKTRVTKKMYGSDSLYSSYVNIPALPMKVIREASSIEQLITVALQMRGDLKSLREWLISFQNAMSSDDTGKLLKYRKQLDSVSKYIDKKLGVEVNENPVTMEAGVGIFKISNQSNPLESLKNQFGIRATLNKLVFGGAGSVELRKFVKMFEADKSKVGYQIEHFFTRNSE